MKKLMIALAAVAMAATSQAALYNWKAVAGYVYDAGQATTKADGTAYLFNAGTVSQQALLTAILGGTDISSLSYVSTGAMSGGRVQPTADFTYNGVAGGSTWDAYMAVVKGDAVYISALKTGIVAPADQSATAIAISSNTTASQAALKTSDTFSGAGWYAATPAPEPTSGLLLLLGVAGLALRRKRA